MGMELTQNVAYGSGGFLVLGRRGQAKLRHGVYDPPLDRFQAIPDVGQRAVKNHVHGILQVRLLGVITQRDAFETVVRCLKFRHKASTR